MLDKIKHIRIGEKEYPIAFTLNVMENIQEKYGSLDKWSDILEPKKTGGEEDKALETNIKDLIWTFEQFINEGIDIENEEKEEKRPFITHKQAGRLITNIKEIGSIIKGITVDSFSSGENDPNEMTKQNPIK